MGDPHKNSGSNDNDNDNDHIGNQKKGAWESLADDISRNISIDPSPIREDIVMRIVESVHPAETLAHCIDDVIWLLSPLLTTPTKSDPTHETHSEPPPPSVGMLWDWEPFVSFFPKEENGDPNDGMEVDDIINISRRSIPHVDHGGNANDCGHNKSSSRRNSSTTVDNNSNNASLFTNDRTMSPSEGGRQHSNENNEETKPSLIEGIQFNEMFDSPEDSFADHGVGEEVDGSDNDDDAQTIDEEDDTPSSSEQPPSSRGQHTIAGVHSDATSQTARPARKSTRTAATASATVSATTTTTAATINTITSSLSSSALLTVERASGASLRQPDPPPAVSDTTASSTPTNVRFRSHHPKMWQQRYEELVQYKTQHGHCFVDPKAFKSLSAWTKRQRHQYRRKREGRTSTLTDEREEKLQSINFAWDAHEAIWELRFQELLRFKEQRGHTNVPGLYAQNPQLGIWVKCQRKQYATDQEKLTSIVAPPSSTSSRTSGNSVDSQQYDNDAKRESQDNDMSQHMVVRQGRYARLESIGFQWIARQQQQQGNAET